MQAMVPNMRREKFQDPRVRRALNFALDFEDLNQNLAYNGLARVDSFFWGTELASSGLPEGRDNAGKHRCPEPHPSGTAQCHQ